MQILTYHFVLSEVGNFS